MQLAWNQADGLIGTGSRGARLSVLGSKQVGSGRGGPRCSLLKIKRMG